MVIAIKNDISNLTGGFLGIDFSLEDNLNGNFLFSFFGWQQPFADVENYYDYFKNKTPYSSEIKYFGEKHFYSEIQLRFEIERLLKKIRFFTYCVTTIHHSKYGLTITTDGPVSTREDNNFSNKLNKCCKNFLCSNLPGRPRFTIAVKNDDQYPTNFLKKPVVLDKSNIRLLLFSQLLFHNKNSNNNFSSFEIPGTISLRDPRHNKYHAAIQSLQNIVENTNSWMMEYMKPLSIVLQFLLKNMGLIKNGKDQKNSFSFFRDYLNTLSDYITSPKDHAEVLRQLKELKYFFNDKSCIEEFFRKIEEHNLHLSKDSIKNIQFAFSLIDKYFLTKKCIEFAAELCVNPALGLHKKGMDYLTIKKKESSKTADHCQRISKLFCLQSNNIVYDIENTISRGNNRYINALNAFKKFIKLQDNQYAIEHYTMPPINDLEQFFSILNGILKDEGFIKQNKYQTISHRLLDIKSFLANYCHNAHNQEIKNEIIEKLYLCLNFFSDKNSLEKLPYPKNFLEDLGLAFSLISDYLSKKFINYVEEFFKEVDLNRSIIDKKAFYGIFIRYQGKKITNQTLLNDENTKEFFESFLQNKK